uniref:Coat protein n=1 Tax=Apple necrotic mosaic virus TaxID=1779339 RepID=A0A3S9LMQ7_9BROM|nr:coat protein [Apple necrotic mosaic virus]
MVCNRCHHTHAGGCRSCRQCHPRDAAPPPPRARARAQNVAARGLARPATSAGEPRRLQWTVIGPNEVPRVPRGYVAHSNREVVATSAGKFLHVNFSTTFPHLLGLNLRILSVVVRASCLVSAGWVGMVEDHVETDLRGPSALSRKGFRQDQPRGWQWLAPSDLEYDRFANSHRLVFEVKNEFAAGVKVLVRDIYVVVSDLPRIVIPNDILMVDEDLLDV